MAHLVKATVTAIDDGQATLTLENGATVQWPADQLPDDTIQGSVVHMVSNGTQAKALLNELLSE